MNEFFFSALSFGLAAGLKPGPLGIVVIQQTLSRGLPSGLRASMAPLITDGPIIIAALWFLSQFKSIDLFAAVLSIFGGLYLLWLSQKMFRIQNVSISSKLGSDASLGTAVKVNLLNPGPYLFWFTVGGSYIVRGTTTESLVFVVTAIGTLIASKIAVALLAANFLPSLESRGYLATMKVLAAMLAAFGLLSLAVAYQLVVTNACDFYALLRGDSVQSCRGAGESHCLGRGRRSRRCAAARKGRIAHRTYPRTGRRPSRQGLSRFHSHDALGKEPDLRRLVRGSDGRDRSPGRRVAAEGREARRSGGPEPGRKCRPWLRRVEGTRRRDHCPRARAQSRAPGVCQTDGGRRAARENHGRGWKREREAGLFRPEPGAGLGGYGDSGGLPELV
jgi:threonine/homoserine/homoserine lactone efflux protein